MGLFDSLSSSYQLPKSEFSVVLSGGEILTFTAPSREYANELVLEARHFAEQYIGDPELAEIKLSTELRIRVFLIHALLVSATKDDEPLDLPTVAQWAMIARDSYQLIDAIFKGMETQTSVTVVAADAKVIEEAKKKSAPAGSSSTDFTPPQSISEDTPTSAKESQ